MTALPERGEFVIRGGLVMTMDPLIGTFEVGDVHVRDGEIIGVGAHLDAGPASVIDGAGMFVLPGFVETHWHLWNAIYRNLINVQGRYLAVKHELAPYHTAADFHASVRMAMLEALDAGITTVHDFAHNVVAPEYADAEIAALDESGLRARFSYGWPDAMSNDEVMPLDDIERVQRSLAADGGPGEGRLTLGLVARGPQYTEEAVWGKEFDRAKALGLPIAIHAGPFARPVSAVQLRDLGFLGPDTMLVQFQRLTEGDRDAMLETGAWNSLGALLLHLRGPIAADIDNLVRSIDAGVNTCLSIDSTPISTVSMFDAMRSLWQLGVPAASGGAGHGGGHGSGHGAPTHGGDHGAGGHGSGGDHGAAGHGAGGHGAAAHGGAGDGSGHDAPAAVGPISLRRCLEMGTIDGARALGLGAVTGSLTPGKRADIVMIRATDVNLVPAGDPEVALVCSATVGNVDTVIADGRILKSAGRIVGLDVDAIKADATRSLAGIRQRAGGHWAHGPKVTH